MKSITVGLPLYNNASTLVRAVDSIFSQSHTELEIIISDDCSTDDTWQLCKELANKDKRIKIYRQPTNLYYNNFKFVLDKSTSPYFVWLAGDDYWDPTYLEKCHNILENDPAIVGCVAKCQFIFEGKKDKLSEGTYPLRSTTEDNIAKYFSNPFDNTRMYGVFRTKELSESFPDKIMHAYDWVLAASTLRFGNHFELSEVLMYRDKTSRADYAKLAARDNSFILYKIFPILKMSIHVIKSGKIPITRKIISSLIFTNYNKHEEIMRYNYPRTHKYLQPVYSAIKKHLLWRFDYS